MYHTARMQRVFATRFSGDGAYVFSGSDDMTVRVWKVCAPRLSPALRFPQMLCLHCVHPLLWRCVPASLLCQLATLGKVRSPLL